MFSGVAGLGIVVDTGRVGDSSSIDCERVEMQYKVLTAMIDKLDEGDQFEVVSDWVEADNPCHAAVVFMLDRPVPANFDREYLDPIVVVEKDTYSMGNYTHAAINVACDYEVGLRT